MVGLELKLGVMYRTVDQLSLIKIVTEVDVGTYEYNLGGRFLGNDDRSAYKADGTAIFLHPPFYTRNHSVSKEDHERTIKEDERLRSIAGEAEPSSLKSYRYGNTFRLSKDELMKSSRYVPFNNLESILTLGEVYVDRTGRLVLFSLMEYHGTTDEDDQFYSDSHRNYTRTGLKVRSKRDYSIPSMFDIVFKRIR